MYTIQSWEELGEDGCRPASSVCCSRCCRRSGHRRRRQKSGRQTCCSGCRLRGQDSRRSGPGCLGSRISPLASRRGGRRVYRRGRSQASCQGCSGAGKRQRSCRCWHERWTPPSCAWTHRQRLVLAESAAWSCRAAPCPQGWGPSECRTRRSLGRRPSWSRRTEQMWYL